MKSQAIHSKEPRQTPRRGAYAGATARDARDGAVSSPPEARAGAAPDPREPSSYPRRVLLAVTGLSPQVITETLYTLCKKQPTAFVPTEVYLITTVEGAERARLALLSEDPGWFSRFLQDYSLPHITFNENHIYVLHDAQDKPLMDIRTQGDNERTADFITETVRSLTSDPTCALHVSIAGGRKTMGYYLGYALSLYGRAQDMLSHVLVSEPFESSWDFFYPTPYSRVITTRDNKLADTASAEVMLADIPFVSLRHGLPENLLVGRSSFSETVAAARRALGPPELVIELKQKHMTAAGVSIRLPATDLAFYCVYARRRIGGLEPIPCPPDGAPELEYVEPFLAEYRCIIGPMGDDERTTKALANGMSKGYFLERKTEVNKALRKALGPGSKPYEIQAFGKRPRTRFGLALNPAAIRLS